MQKLLLHLDTDPIPSSFDAVVGYDGGADHVIQYASVNSGNCEKLVEGAIYTRAATNKKHTAILISGSDLTAGQDLFDAVQNSFFSDFRVSLMFDSNGCNTTAAAAVALLEKQVPLQDKTVLILAGTGPVGQRVALMSIRCGADVYLGSRSKERAAQVCDTMEERFGIQPIPVGCGDDEQISTALDGVEVVFATGKTGIQLLKHTPWISHPKLQALADVNTRPPSGIEGIKITDCGQEYGDKVVFGGLGIGALKLKLQRLCIGELFTSNTHVLDADTILEIARKLIRAE